MNETHTHYTVYEVDLVTGDRSAVGSFSTLEEAKDLISDLGWDNVVIAKITTEFLD